jgi:hypothetical protein
VTATVFAPSRQALDLFSRPCRHQAAAENERPDLVWHDPAATCATCVEEELTRTYHLGYLAAVEAAAQVVWGFADFNGMVEAPAFVAASIRALAVPLPPEA